MKITWYEAFNGYYLQAEDWRTACIGDGVDMFTGEDDLPIAPGTPEFAACMDALCAAPDVEAAYFPAAEPPISADEAAEIFGLPAAEPPHMAKFVYANQAAEPPRMTLQQAAQAAIEVQNACNISGVILSFADIITNTLRPYAYEHGKSTEWVNQHAIVRMFCSKLVSLADYDDASGFSAAYAEVQRLAAPAAPAEPPAAPAAEPPAAKCPLCGSSDMELLDGNGNDWECLDCGEFFVADYDDSDCSPSGPIG